MKLMLTEVEKIFKDNIEKIFGKEFSENAGIQYSTRKEFGDFQTNFAMVNSKRLGKNPREIATEIIEKFEQNPVIEKMEIAGQGFLNIFIKNSKLNEDIKKIGVEKYEFPIDTSKKFIIDYSSPNIAKRMHIGHLRSTIIGDSLKKILEYIGFTVLGDNHIGDWGTQFGKLIVGYNKWIDREEYEKNPIGELERIYVKFSEEAKLNPELEVLAREELRKVQAGDEVNINLWKDFIKCSLKEYDKVYKKLDIEFDLYNGESFYNEMMPGVLEMLKEKGIAVTDNEALVVFFKEEDKLPPCIVQKKDGSFLYSTSDLATIKYRKDDLDIDTAIYVVDERQKDHFRQVFKIAEMVGTPYDYEKYHVAFGIMRFEDGVILSSRKGNVVHLIDILEQAKTEARKIIDTKNPSLSEEEKEEISEVVGIGAIKYFDLSQNRTSAILFSWDKVLNFEGNTSPYLQYTYARIMSIFRKLKENGVSYDRDYNLLSDGLNSNERELATALLKFPYWIIKSYEGYKPNLIADYLFETAKIFNSFYASESILKEENKEKFNTRLMLAEKTAFVIKEGLSLLGIKVVERM